MFAGFLSLDTTRLRSYRTRLHALLSPARLFVLSFVLLIGMGTIGFLALPGLYTAEPLSPLDALFTATSAVCVTGLIVVDTATYFTPLGQAYVLLLIQLGGLGMITLTSLVITSLGFRLSLRQEDLARSYTNLHPHISPRRLITDIVIFTLAVEAIGAVLLYAAFVPEFGRSGAVWPAVFHSISAFCNAGFSIFSDSLMTFDTAPGILIPVMALIVLGGIGFLTLEEVVLRFRNRKNDRRATSLSLHSKIVLTTTALLLVVGWILFAAFEWSISLDGLHSGNKLVNALFMSVTARTAGFNTVDYAGTATNSNFLTILLMSVGGSPGSTAGGLKTTTIAIIGLVAYSRLRGYEHTSLWNRSIRKETTDRAVGVFVLAFGLLTTAIFLLTSTELLWIDQTDARRFLPIMFEAVSAFNTVGLSMGVTGDLSSSGRAITIIMMFVGRVGPLAFASALAARHARRHFRYAHENVTIG
jgi:trk system potassium uptake protein